MALKKLDLRDSVGGAYAALAGNLGSFFILLAGWVALVVAAIFGGSIVASWLSEAFPSVVEAYAALPFLVQTALGFVPFAIASSVATISMVVAWHRRIINGVVPDSPYPTDLGAIWGYLWRVVAMFVVAFVPLMLLTVGFGYLVASLAQPPEPQPNGNLIFSIFTLVISCAAALVAGRFGLVFPAWAVGDRTMTFARAWGLTKGNTWLLFWGGVASVLPFSLVQSACELVLKQQPITTAEPAPIVYVLGAIALLADMIAYIMAAGFYSFAYLQLGAPDESHIVQAPPALER